MPGMRRGATGNVRGRARPTIGTLRPSQMLHTFGVGAIIDLPNISAMVLGLDDWSGSGATEIGEERLLEAVRLHLGQQVAQLLSPPVQIDDGQRSQFDGEEINGAPVAPFPRWMLCPFCHLLAPLDSSLFQLKIDPFHSDRTRYEHTNCRKPGRPPTVLPARFLVACQAGHLDEFPWSFFVHRGSDACTGRLTLTEYGGLGDAAAIQLKCEACGAHRQMSDAFGDEGKLALPRCRGRYPHLREFSEQPCTESLRAILLGASNSWFGLTVKVLSVPRATDRLRQLVDISWHVLEKAESAQNIRLLRQIGQLPQLDTAYSDDEVWAAVARKRTGDGADADLSRNLKLPEWQVFTNPTSAPQLPDFCLVEAPAPRGYEGIIRRVVRAERLREVSALVGFTRLASPGDFSDTSEMTDAWRVPLARRPPRWVPAVEVHGEGLFLQFEEAAIATWLDQTPGLAARDAAFRAAYRQWRRRRRLDPSVGYLGLRYVLLHSFAHALVRELVLECGYSMSSIDERIYALEPTDDDGPMAGVLLYTAAPDSEGTLGGLVNLGQPETLGRHIDAALEQIRLCASDPYCAERGVEADGTTLHGACCHACLFTPETSCERGNTYLDRALLVPTVDTTALAFFSSAI